MLQSKVDDFLEYLLYVRGYSKYTIVTYSIALKQMLKYSKLIENQNNYILDIQLFRVEISSNSKKTISKKISAVRSFVNYLEKQRDLTIIIKGNSSIRVPQTLPKPIDEDYISEVLAIADIREKLLISILYGLGLRISEASYIELEDMRPDWLTVRGKGRKSRQLPILAFVATLIDAYKEQYRPKKYLFEKNTIPMNTNQLRYIINRVFKKAGLKVTPHQLRHSFATHLLNHGARISDVSELLGHSSMATTQIYTKLESNKKLKEYMSAHPLV